jgi:serine/threonine protein kinase/formylglycine-generating enzyme required for sulfatase activity
MKREDLQRIKSVYERAFDLVGAEREAFLEEACRGELGVRLQVEQMLGEAESDDDFLRSPREVGRLDLPVPELPRDWHNLGDFEILEEIGSGAMGRVYRSRQLSLDREVAVKVIQPHLSASSHAIERFHQEATAVARLRHPNIVPVYSVGEEGGRHYFAMEYVRGRSLQEILEALKEEQGRPRSALPSEFFGDTDESYPAGVARLVVQVAEALQYSHENKIIHRDVKPQNILVDGEHRPHIVDFGLAKDLELESLIHSGQIVGTPYYMSPEQARNKKDDIDHRSDIFSLGVVMYELLTLQRPFEGYSHIEVFRAICEERPTGVRKLAPKVPRDLETICAKAMEKEPGHRYESAGAFAADLHRFLSHESIMARPPSTFELTSRFLARNRGRIAAAVLVLLALVVGGVFTSKWTQARKLERSMEPLVVLAAAADLSSVESAQLEEALHKVRELREIFAPLPAHAEERLAEIEGLIHAHGEERLHWAMDAMQEPGSTPWEYRNAILHGIDDVLSSSRLLPDAERRSARELLGPRLVLRSGEPGATVYLQEKNAIDETLGPPEQLGLTPLDTELDPGCYRITILAQDGRYAELTRVLDSQQSYAFDAPLRSTDEVTADMIRIPASTFTVGEGVPGQTPYPRQQARTAAFWIDRTEVSNAAYRRFCDATGRARPEHWGEEYDAALDDLPITGIRVEDAEAYALWAGKRLPTHVEWERAARGTDGRAYPWGNDASLLGTHAVLGPRTGLRLNGDNIQSIQDLLWEAYFENVREVDSLPEGASPDGLLHALGNVQEWTESFALGLEGGGPRVQPATRVVKGWSFALGRGYGLGGGYPAPRDLIYSDLGFRCAKSVRP